MANYIDRDLALSLPFANGEYDHEHANEHFIYGCETYKEWLKGMPVADVAPVIHAHWIDDNGLYRCSACNHLWSELWWTSSCPIDRMNKIMPYCPHCGAKMDEENDNA